MCDSVTRQLIENAVNNKVQNSEMFTAFDITNEVRKQSKDNINHYEVRKEVKKIFQSGGMNNYTQTIGNLPGVNPQPWVYHPFTSDASLYQPNIAPTPPAATSSSDDDEEDEDEYSVDARKTLCIPAKYLREAGFASGDEAFVIAGSNNIFVTKNHNNHTQLSSYKVDMYGNVRVTQSILRKGGIAGSRFRVERKNNTIKVEKV